LNLLNLVKRITAVKRLERAVLSGKLGVAPGQSGHELNAVGGSSRPADSNLGRADLAPVDSTALARRAASMLPLLRRIKFNLSKLVMPVYASVSKRFNSFCNRYFAMGYQNETGFHYGEDQK